MNIKKLLLIGLIGLMLAASPVFGQARLNRMSLNIVDEFGDDLDWTTLTSVTIYDAGTSDTKTIYSDPGGDTSKTNPIVTGLSTPVISFYCRSASYKVTATDGTYTRTSDNLTGSDTRLFFPSYLPAVSSVALTDAQSTTYGSDTDWSFNAADTTMDITPGADDSALAIGTASYTSDLLLYGGTSGYNLYWDASEDTLELLDNVTIAVGTGDDYTISHNGTTTTVAGAATLSGITTFSTDVVLDGTYDVKFDDSRNQLLFQDSAVLGLGGAADAAGDITFSYDGTDLLMEAAAADDVWKIGATTNFDIIIYGDTATDLITFDTSAEDVQFNGFDILLMDDDILAFGDSDEITIQYDEDGGNDLQIIGDVTIEGTTPLLTVGDAGAEDAIIQLDGSSGDWYYGVDETDDDLKIGEGSTMDTTPAITIYDSTQIVEFEKTVTFTGGQTKSVIFTINDVENDSTVPAGTTSIGTSAQAEFDVLGFDANPNATGDDYCFINWVVPAGYVADSGDLHVYWSHSTAEDAADEITIDGTVNAVAAGEALDAAGTGMAAVASVIADASASAGTLIKTSLDIEVEDIAVGDLVTIAFFVDESASLMAASGTADVHYFEITYESTE
jgi:hypothetical protein